MPSLFCSVHQHYVQLIPPNPMIKTIHRPSSARHRVFDVLKVMLTARQNQDIESYMTYHGCSYSAAFNAKFVPIV